MAKQANIQLHYRSISDLKLRFDEIALKKSVLFSQTQPDLLS